MEDNREVANESSENLCVVCFKNVEIYSIGECDHPVCYECSTRMRVLCEQNECPICRKTLFKVIFTNEIQPYQVLQENNRSEYYHKKYKICFSNPLIKKAFYDLLEHPCPKCDINRKTFYSFDELKDHVRKEHELFYCDICSANLKIFSFEKKCYNRQELALHRRKGDPDNTSHRGHPLCQYCDVRFLDREELFRHLRLKHFYCHICDADGAHQYYADYESLCDHFRSDHYLCEEGECASNGLTAVFRTEIDLKGHLTSVHSKSLGKQQAKQARTLQLEITLGPRLGRNISSVNNNLDLSNESMLRSNRNDVNSNNKMESFRSMNGTNHNPTRIIDANDDQEFPSLRSANSSSAGASAGHPKMSIRTKAFGPPNLIRSQDFPALCGVNGVGANSNNYDTGPNINQNSKRNPSIVSVKKKPSAQQQANINSGGNSMVIHVSNRPNVNNNNVTNFLSDGNKTRTPITTTKAATTTIKKLSNQEDFSALINNDPTVSNINISSVVSAKHRSLIKDHISATNYPQSSSKITVVQKALPSLSSPVSTSSKKSETKNSSTSVPSLTKNDFPELGGGNRKPRRTPTPTSPGSVSNSSSTTSQNFEIKQKRQDQVKNICLKSDSNEKKSKKQSNKSNSKKSASSDKENKNQNIITTNTNVFNGKNYSDFQQHNSNVVGSNINWIPPPGFDQIPYSRKNFSIESPPPGFKSVTLNSVVKPPNDLTFTNSLGETFSIVPSHTFIQPPDSEKRNQELVRNFQNTLLHPAVFEEFKHISKKFREGQYKTLPYYEHCQAALKDKFDEYFPELLALLPDINKQQELYLVHCQNTKNKNQKKLEVCPQCKQVLLTQDKQYHLKAHSLENNFPTLIGAMKKLSITSGKNRK